MPNATSGFTGNEIVSRIQSYIGNYSSSLQTYIQQTLPLAEFRFCKVHDWRFLKKTNLSLNITNGTEDYALSTGTIGYYMSSADVENIFHPASGTYLAKKSLNEIRRLDPQNNAGSNIDTPAMWCELDDNQIKIWPPSIETGVLKIDGKITPAPLHNLANFPTIPYRYQESFIEYVKALILDRENDDRAAAKKVEAMALIREDIKDDKGNLSADDESRIRSLFEKEQDGTGSNSNWWVFCD